MVAPVIISNASKSSRDIQLMKFGLIPSFTSPLEKPNHYVMFNASKFYLYEYLEYGIMIMSF
jgi:hypothetical protein